MKKVLQNVKLYFLYKPTPQKKKNLLKSALQTFLMKLFYLLWALCNVLGTWKTCDWELNTQKKSSQRCHGQLCKSIGSKSNRGKKQTNKQEKKKKETKNKLLCTITSSEKGYSTLYCHCRNVCITGLHAKDVVELGKTKRRAKNVFKVMVKLSWQSCKAKSSKC